MREELFIAGAWTRRFVGRRGLRRRVAASSRFAILSTLPLSLFAFASAVLEASSSAPRTWLRERAESVGAAEHAALQSGGSTLSERVLQAHQPSSRCA